MTGLEWNAYVVRKFKRGDKDTELYEATTEIIADMRRKFISDEYSQEAYLAGISTVGDSRMAVPSDLGHFIGTISMTDTDDDSEYTPLIKLSKQEFDGLYSDRLLSSADNMNTGVPKHFCIYATQVHLGPVPDRTTFRYQINYSTEAFTAVVAGTTDVPFSGKYRNILRSGVLSELHDGLENYQEAQYWLSKYNNDLYIIANQEKENRTDESQVQYHGI